MSAEPLFRANRVSGRTEESRRFKPGGSPHFRDFADLGEESFIEAAYRVTLKRSPDPGGAECYRGLLSRGISRAEILTYLIESAEGRPIGVRIEGLAWALRWAAFRRLPIVNRIVDVGRRISPYGDLRRDLRMADDQLNRITSHMQSMEVMIQRCDLEAQQRSETLRSELLRSLATRADANSVGSLQASMAELSAGMTEIRKLVESKVDQSEIDRTQDEMRTTLYRGIDDVDRKFRMLLDAKAGTDALAELRAATGYRVHAVQQVFERQIQTLEARKADLDAIEAIRTEMLAALRTALTGLTGSVTAVAASRVDRLTMNALLAENSQTLLTQFQDSVRQLRSSIEEMSER